MVNDYHNYSELLVENCSLLRSLLPMIQHYTTAPYCQPNRHKFITVIGSLRYSQKFSAFILKHNIIEAFLLLAYSHFVKFPKKRDFGGEFHM